MHRAVCRALRGSCRKWRESEYPVVSGEDVKSNKWKNQEFIPPKHSWNEALGWTTGLVLAYQLTHRKCTLGEETGPFSTFNTNGLKKCPFGVAKNVVSQPIVSTVHNVVDHKSKARGIRQRNSIDATPFLKEDNLSLFDPSVDFTKELAENECDIVFEEEKPTNILKASLPLQTKKLEEKESEKRPTNVDQILNRFSGDLYSVLGAFTFLHQGPKENSENGTVKIIVAETPSKTPPIHAMELLTKGAELGSSRALYNIGVAYDRMKEPKLAREYYRKAADLGHPLATYNLSIFLLKDGNFAEGLTLMRIAAEKGVPEAKRVLKDVDV